MVGFYKDYILSESFLISVAGRNASHIFVPHNMIVDRFWLVYN